MKYLSLLLSLAGVLFGLTALAAAEGTAGGSGNRMQTVTFDASTTTIVMELGAILTEVDKRLVVDQLLPMPPKAGDDETPKLEKGDVIVMINGRRITSRSDFQAVYDEAETDKEIKLGVKRGESMQLVAFTKRDRDDMPGTRIMMTTEDDDAEGASPGGTAVQRIEMSPSMVPLMGVGLLLDEADGAVIVKQLLPNAADVFAEGDVMADDKVIAVNGTPVATSQQFSDIYDAIEVDAEVTLTLRRAGAERTLTFVKPKSAGTLIRKTQ